MPRSMPPPHDRASASSIAGVLDASRLDGILTPWIPDPTGRAFVVRCIVGEGPIHHRGSSYALIALAGAIAERLEPLPAVATDGPAVPMRQAPHLAVRGQEAPTYPLRLDLHGLGRIAGGDADTVRTLTDALLDGPPHHALANAVLLDLLSAILRRLEQSR